MTLQQSLAGDLFTFLVVLTLLTWAIATATWWIRKRRTARPHDHCRIGACRGAPYAIYDKHPSGPVVVCRRHAQQIRAAAGRRLGLDKAVYDQDLAPGSDLALWDQEVGS